MFARPYYVPGEITPAAIVHPDQLIPHLTALGVSLDLPGDVLRQATDYAVKYWTDAPEPGGGMFFDMSWQTAPEVATFRGMGLIDAITPHDDAYDHAVVDGGSMPVLDYRLAFLEEQLRQGLAISTVALFGGQRLRSPFDDANGRLEDRATASIGSADIWGKAWLAEQLGRNPHDADLWRRPFATEHEMGVLALLERYGRQAQHVDTITRATNLTAHPSIPPAKVAAERFDLGGTEALVLNAPAIIREMREVVLPVEEARPTGKSCFMEWYKLTYPAEGTSALVVTHNPNIYRSWVDVLQAVNELDRPDIVVEGIGASIEPARSRLYVLRSFGKLLVALYNLREAAAGPQQQPVA